MKLYDDSQTGGTLQTEAIAPYVATAPERVVDKKKSTLEGLVDVVKNVDWKGYIVDTSGSLLYSTPIAAAREYLVDHMTLNEVAHSRAVMGAFGLVAYRPFNQFRNAFANYFNVNDKSPGAIKTITDAVAGIVFFTPVYMGAMMAAGDSPEKIKSALITGTVSSILNTIPYRIAMDGWRNLFGMKPVLASKKLEIAD